MSVIAVAVEAVTLITQAGNVQVVIPLEESDVGEELFALVWTDGGWLPRDSTRCKRPRLEGHSRRYT